MRRVARRAVDALLVLLLASAAGGAQAPTREECEAAHPASWGRAGKDVVWVPTFDAVVHAMLTIAEVGPEDVVLDLGAGDGRISIAAAKPPFGARSVGIEYDPALARRAACLVAAEGVADRVRIVEGDIFREDFGEASVVTLYLLPQLNLCVRHRLLAMKAGTRVVSHQFAMAEWKPDRSVQIQGRDVHLWVVPARVDGVWDLEYSQGARLAVDLRQDFGEVSGEVDRGTDREPLTSGSVRGDELRFAYVESGTAVRFSGTVRGREVTGVLHRGTTARTAVGRLREASRESPWAAMPADCGRYYPAAPPPLPRGDQDDGTSGVPPARRVPEGGVEKGRPDRPEGAEPVYGAGRRTPLETR